MMRTEGSPASFGAGQSVRLTRDVTFRFIDPKWDGPWLSPDDYERVEESLVLLAGTVAVFDTYLTYVASLHVATPGKRPTNQCDIVVGLHRRIRATVSPDALALVEPGVEPTPLPRCVDSERLPLDHFFRADPL